MKTGPGSDARWLAYAIDALIIARFSHFFARDESVIAKKEAVDSKIEELERRIGEVL